LIYIFVEELWQVWWETTPNHDAVLWLLR
jgi:hypothetical protein